MNKIKKDDEIIVEDGLDPLRPKVRAMPPIPSTAQNMPIPQSNSSTTGISNTSTEISAGIKAFFGGKTLEALQAKKTKNLTFQEVPMNDEGVRELAKNECWEQINMLCEKIFSVGKQNFLPDEIIQFKLSQLVSLLRICDFNRAGEIADDLGNLSSFNSFSFYIFIPKI